MPNDVADLNSGNIIKPTLEELSEEHRQKYDQRLQEFEDEQRRHRQEFEDAMISCFQKTRQGGVILKEPELPAVTGAPKVRLASEIVSDLKQEMSFMVDQSVTAQFCNASDNFMKNLEDKMKQLINERVGSVSQQSVPQGEKKVKISYL
jgi:DNA-binding transcriptional regulator YbjK